MIDERPPRTVFLGDSITASGHWAVWFPRHETHNLGVSGDTTDGVLARFDEVVAIVPDNVSLLIGTNDLGRGRSVEHVVRNIEYLMVGLRRELPGARTLVQSVMPRGAEHAERVQDVNRHLRQFSPTVRCLYLDLWPALATEEGDLRSEYTDDGVHLTPAGYQAWLGELQPAMERLEDAPPMSRPIQVV